MTPSPVPPAYVGVWRRTLLKTPTLRDTTTRVFWLQTDVWHADIRIPANRPELSGDTLACLDRSAMRALAQQQGFAGITEVSGDVCRWHRKIDYQPPGRFNDVGRMRFDTPDRLFEYGVEQDYFEIWERVDGSGGDSAVLELNTPSQPRSLLLVRGKGLHLGEVEAKVADWPDHGVVLEERPVTLQGLLEMCRLVRGSEATPGHQVGARGNDGGWVDLEERQLLDDCQQIGRSRCVQHLGANRDPPSLGEREPNGVHQAVTFLSASAKIEPRILATTCQQ